MRRGLSGARGGLATGILDFSLFWSKSWIRVSSFTPRWLFARLRTSRSEKPVAVAPSLGSTEFYYLPISGLNLRLLLVAAALSLLKRPSPPDRLYPPPSPPRPYPALSPRPAGVSPPFLQPAAVASPASLSPAAVQPAAVLGPRPLWFSLAA
ncbi:hypothetical protein ZWY2020_013732 [Hordeum vulgare]|nr:hypothetical protein ZWY2020_013732 [Hordeum vulgare]